MKGKKKQNYKDVIINSNSSLYVLVIFLILILIILGVAFSYAFWTSTETQTDKNDVTAGCLSFTFNDKDLDNNATSISLLNTYPMSDEKGMIKSPYTFTITNTCNLTGSFDINLHTLATSDLSSKYIKAYLTSSSTNIVVEPTIVSKLADSPILGDAESSISSKVGAISESYLLTSVTLAPEESATYNLRLWIDYDAPNTIMEQTYNSAVSVVATVAE